MFCRHRLFMLPGIVRHLLWTDWNPALSKEVLVHSWRAIHAVASAAGLPALPGKNVCTRVRVHGPPADAGRGPARLWKDRIPVFTCPVHHMTVTGWPAPEKTGSRYLRRLCVCVWEPAPPPPPHMSPSRRAAPARSPVCRERRQRTRTGRWADAGHTHTAACQRTGRRPDAGRIRIVPFLPAHAELGAIDYEPQQGHADDGCGERRTCGEDKARVDNDDYHRPEAALPRHRRAVPGENPSTPDNPGTAHPQETTAAGHKSAPGDNSCSPRTQLSAALGANSCSQRATEDAVPHGKAAGHAPNVSSPRAWFPQFTVYQQNAHNSERHVGFAGAQGQALRPDGRQEHNEEANRDCTESRWEVQHTRGDAARHPACPH
eukprot:gene24744-biopygen13475